MGYIRTLWKNFCHNYAIVFKSNNYIKLRVASYYQAIIHTHWWSSSLQRKCCVQLFCRLDFFFNWFETRVKTHEWLLTNGLASRHPGKSIFNTFCVMYLLFWSLKQKKDKPGIPSNFYYHDRFVHRVMRKKSLEICLINYKNRKQRNVIKIQLLRTCPSFSALLYIYFSWVVVY